MILSLCSGIGALDYAVERLLGQRVILYAEKAYWPALVMARHFPDAKNLGDITRVDWASVAVEHPEITTIVAGFPCQDISHAGPRGGIGGRRSGLWAYVATAIREIRPGFVFLENVAGIRKRGLDVVSGDLAGCGYDLEWVCLRASAVGAPHHRFRWFGVATPSNPNRSR
ncbi:DNA cytosine methyltransferase [Streptomyces sp. SID13726]|uniref:DNA cytosine methyltransferase n=1 Tax=Streptomyces sp. SID13726 TaxID=2706058 RepID=UPI0013BAE8AD|nr:DNA cytosine methyltransferase [Streptomyces sp. SID13726]